MNTTTLLKTIAVVESATGVGLLALPSTGVELLAGQPLGSGVPILVARVAGAALFAIGLACWLEAKTRRPGVPTGLLAGLLAYNGMVPVLLIHSYVASGTSGIGLWPTVVLHAAFTLWIAAGLRFHLAAHRLSTP